MKPLVTLNIAAAPGFNPEYPAVHLSWMRNPRVGTVMLGQQLGLTESSLLTKSNRR